GSARRRAAPAARARRGRRRGPRLPVGGGGGEDVCGELLEDGGGGLLLERDVRGVVVGVVAERAREPLAVLDAVEVADADGDGDAVERGDLVPGDGGGLVLVALDADVEERIGGALVGLEGEAR